MSHLQLLSCLDLDRGENARQVFELYLSQQQQQTRSSDEDEELLELNGPARAGRQLLRSQDLEDRLPELPLNELFAGDRTCRCASMGVEEQVARVRAAKVDYYRKQEATNPAAPDPPVAGEILRLVPSAREQLEAFGGFILRNRNTLARQMIMGARRGRKHNQAHSVWATQTDVVSLSLYKLEDLLREAHNNLASNLQFLASRSASCMSRFLVPAEGEAELFEEKSAQNPAPLREPDHLLVRAPIEPALVSSVREVTGDDAHSRSQDSGFDAGEIMLGPVIYSSRSSSASESDSQTASLAALQVDKLVGLLKFRSQPGTLRLVSESLRIFNDLLTSSDLFRLTDSAKVAGSWLTLQELKLLACVECKKLRSFIRFEWVTQCLVAVFGEQMTDKKVANKQNTRNRKELPKRGTSNGIKLPQLIQKPLDSSGQFGSSELEFFNSIAQLMSALLRQHFLVPAIDLWCNQWEAYLDLQPAGRSRDASCGHINSERLTLPSIVSIQVGLAEFSGAATAAEIELDAAAAAVGEKEGSAQLYPPRVAGGAKAAQNVSANPQQVGKAAPLALSKPREQLQEALAFVVDELASVCKHLPRLESQLESALFLAIEPVEAQERGASERNDELVVLQAGDGLVQDTKLRLWRLIDDLRPLTRSTFIDGERPGADWIDARYSLALDTVNLFRSGNGNAALLLHNLAGRGDNRAADDRLELLEQSYKEIHLLNSLEMQLNCSASRYFDLGFVVLDCSGLRESLIKSIRTERLLLIRLNLDDLLRLMEQLRLQFDEIEVSADLDAAIEDYLAERQQIKQHQLQNSRQQVAAHLLENADDPFHVDCFQQTTDDAQATATADGWHPLIASVQDHHDAATAAQKSGEIEREIDQDEEFAVLLASPLASGNSGHHHLLAMSAGNRANPPSSSQQQQQQIGPNSPLEPAVRRVAPFVECKLLVAKFEFMSQLMTRELEPLARDLGVAFEGLVFLSEFVSQEQLEPAHSELISELAGRSREFTSIMAQLLGKLHLAREQLLRLNATRSWVLSKLVVEFHLLLEDLGQRRLAPAATPTAAAVNATEQQQQQHDTKGKGSDVQALRRLNVGQLDSIQETAEWARELAMRHQFLLGQNRLLARERELLHKARELSRLDLFSRQSPGEDDGLTPEAEGWATENEATEWRELVLERWREQAENLARLWHLVEEYETQQVKWLNSDMKRIRYESLENVYKTYTQRLGDLEQSCSPSDEILAANLAEVRRRLDEFDRTRLPVFQFVTNPFVTESHWARLASLVEADRAQMAAAATSTARSRIAALSGTSGNVSTLAPPPAPHLCTTLAQLLELQVDKHVEELISMNKQAIIEQELTEFLLTESELSGKLLAPDPKLAQKRSLALARSWFDGWTEQELCVAATRYLEAMQRQTNDADDSPEPSEQSNARLANQLVGIHSLIKRHLRLRYSLNLVETSIEGRAEKRVSPETTRLKRAGKPLLVVVARSCRLLTSDRLVGPSMFIDLLRLFTSAWLEGRGKLGAKMKKLKEELNRVDDHLADIDKLVSQVRELHENYLRAASLDTEKTLCRLEQETVRLELEREILATKEALALEKQREALGRRDEFVRQVTERAIPAIRAAARALNCLDKRWLRAIRNCLPKPAEPARLVIEAVCLIRSCVINQPQVKTGANRRAHFEPERHFEATSGRWFEDFWTPASRMLMGTHSSLFINDLRRVDKRTIPVQVMRLIRRRYLSSPLFRQQLIERVSPECGLLAKWLIAVDVFDRVINVVKPNYKNYMESERRLSDLLLEVNNKRRQIELIGSELQQMEDSFESKISYKMSLVDSLDQCRAKLRQVEQVKAELGQRKETCLFALKRLHGKQARLATRCQLSAAETVYLSAMRFEERKPMTGLLIHLLKGQWLRHAGDDDERDKNR